MEHNTGNKKYSADIAEPKHENKIDFLKRKLRVFRDYYQQKEIMPTCMPGRCCDLCGLDLYSIGYNIVFSHHSKTFNILACDECCRDVGIPRISRIRLLNQVKKEIKQGSAVNVNSQTKRCCVCHDDSMSYGYDVMTSFGIMFFCIRHYTLFGRKI